MVITTVQTKPQQLKENASGGATRVPHPNGYKRTHPKLWAIHGQYYDLHAFLDKHPGGSEMLLLGRGRDCSELFESVHSLSKLSVHKILSKYKVDPPADGPAPPPEIFTWAEDGFYSVLTKRVKAYFDKLSPNGGAEAHKATTAYWYKVAMLFATWVSLFVWSYHTANLLTAFFAGLTMNMIGFCVMHDGSHYGISARPWVNRLLHTLWSDWNLWSHFLWLRHHVYGHHSYTGVFRRDPDLVNASIFLRKHHEHRYSSRFAKQHWFAYFLLTVLPNQHVGQILLYMRSWIVSNVFGVRLEKQFMVDLLVSWAIYVPSIYVHLVLPFTLLPTNAALSMIVAYWSAQGLGYALNIVPNHDTFETHSNASKADAAKGLGIKRDWGEQQVLSSGNHSNDEGLWSTIVSSLWGGMNYQIEHHLYPSVSHVHYPAISKIVRQTCAEFGLPYVTHSWFYSWVSYFYLLKDLAKPGTSQAKKSA